LNAAVIEARVQRIRPKIMTICAMSVWPAAHYVVAHHAERRGRDEAHRRPMIGGVIRLAFWSMLLYPAI